MKYVLTDIAGEHYLTASGGFWPINPADPLPADLSVFDTEEEAERERLRQVQDRECHLRVVQFSR